jgi:hypothetical protein
MDPDFRAATADPKHEVRARVDSGETANPYVLEDPEDGKLALLVDERVIREDCEVDLQLRRPGLS